MLLSNLAMTNKDFEGAEGYLKESLKSSTKMLGQENEGASYFQLGMLAMQKGKTSEARKNFREALKKGLPDNETKAATFLQLSSVEIQARNLKQGRDYFKKAKALKPKTKEIKAQFEKYRSDYLLPSPSASNDIGGNCIDKRSVARAINRKLSEFTIDKWTPHDLRRTVQTHLAALGTDAIVVEKILNHELNGMLKVYNQYDYMKERKSALKNWSELLQREVFL